MNDLNFMDILIYLLFHFIHNMIIDSVHFLYIGASQENVGRS